MTDDRTVAALERIATALEQMALDRLAAPLEMLTVGLPTGEPPLPTPPPEYVTQQITPFNPPPTANAATVALPPVQPAPYQFTGPSAFCPVHRVPWQTVPAGTSKRTGRAYSAFLACPERGCEQRPQALR